MATSASHSTAGTAPSRPWWWVPSLYFAQGVPYVVVMTVAVIMFKRLGVDNTKIALYTSWLYLPYAIKPLWSPLVQRIGTRRGWVVVMQLFVAVGLVCAATAVPLDSFLRWSLVALAAVAICSATHDIAADGFYLIALTSHEQAWFVGIRSTAYRMAMIAGQGLLVMLAGTLESSTGIPSLSIEVQATDVETPLVQFDPQMPADSSESDTQKLLAQDTKLRISLRGRDAAEVAKLKAAVREWNTSHGFYTVAPVAAKGSKRGWQTQLEDFVRRHFGPRQTEPTSSTARVGDVAVVLLKLAHPVPPGEQQVVQFGRAKGDSNFDVVEGERFVVSESNSEQPFAALVQVDPKLRTASQATFETRSGNLRFAWSITFYTVAAVFLAFCVYHYIVLPRPPADIVAADDSVGGADALLGFFHPFAEFFRKPRVVAILAFLLLYRFPESQLVKLTTPFLLDARERGGLALTTSEVGIVYGTIGVAMLTLGGILGGFIVARGGLGRCLWPMALAIHLPNFAFLYLAFAQPESRYLITAAVAVEQFGYGFGFTAYMLYCVFVATGKHQTVHYAICTGCMALGMMIPGMWSGWLQDLIGYKHFFVWIILAMIPSLLTIFFIPVDPNFGKKTDTQPFE